MGRRTILPQHGKRLRRLDLIAMPDHAIHAEGVSKRFTIAHQSSTNRTFRDMLAAEAQRLLLGRGKDRKPGGEHEQFWALHDIAFSIQQGERVGVIGRNGAGKSTLLKLLSRITEPTTGRISIVGRVASLLEVGTGFHPELTGRENIFLNGAILGMTRSEIRARFDEIVAFSEVERFLDTPVKHYSSGMYVRLAFAVAAHLDTEILIVDEVLAVGDSQFQEKCLGKMREVSRQARTVLFVSHNMSAIQALCDRCFVLEKGTIVHDQGCQEAIHAYMASSSQARSFVRDARANGKPAIVRGSVSDLSISGGDVLEVSVDMVSPQAMRCALEMRLVDGVGTPCGFGSLGTLDSRQALQLRAGSNTVRFQLHLGMFATGRYSMSLDLTLPFAEYLDRVDSCLCFEVTRSPLPGSTRVLCQSWNRGCMEIPLSIVGA